MVPTCINDVTTPRLMKIDESYAKCSRSIRPVCKFQPLHITLYNYVRISCGYISNNVMH